MSFISFLQRSAFRRFRNGSSGPWGAIAAGLFGFRMLLKWAKRNEEVVYREVIKPGQSVTVTHRPESRRALAKAENESARQGRRAGRRAAGAVATDA